MNNNKFLELKSEELALCLGPYVENICVYSLCRVISQKKPQCLNVSLCASLPLESGLNSEHPSLQLRVQMLAIAVEEVIFLGPCTVPDR